MAHHVPIVIPGDEQSSGQHQAGPEKISPPLVHAIGDAKPQTTRAKCHQQI